ncbi:MAG: YjfI family protein [Nevskia sp.]|jgi:uncharacterized protein|nr:YjfI family protein [Nevskia sp.]
MERKSSAHYQRLHRDRLREQGLIKKELWVLPEFSSELLEIEKRMRQPRGAGARQLEVAMSPSKSWSVGGLFEALSRAEPFSSGAAGVDFLDGSHPSLHLTMYEYGDLPIFIAVEGHQIIVEALLWPVAQVRNPQAFNEQALRTHKMLPLSTIGIERLVSGESVYVMFGALSSASSLSDVLFEIETLADNVIKTTEAYGPQLLEAV